MKDNSYRAIFSLNKQVVIGEPCEVEMYLDARKGFEQWSEGEEHKGVELRTFRCHRATTNVCLPGCLLLERIDWDGTELLRGELFDAYAWNPNAVGQHIDGPALTKDSKVRIFARYTGRLPVPLDLDKYGSTKWDFSVNFTGPVNLASDIEALERR